MTRARRHSVATAIESGDGRAQGTVVELDSDVGIGPVWRSYVRER